MNSINKIRLWCYDNLIMMVSLLKSIPKVVTLLFILAVILMNLLSRITLLSLPFLALNAGILVSWVSFLLLDVVVKHYGAKSANIFSIVAITVNLICTLICFIISRFTNYPALDTILGGQWSILLASTIAFIISALTNNYTNVSIGRKFHKNPDGKTAFATRTFVSTFFSQIVDNFTFVFLAFVVLPFIPSAFQLRWSIMQCIGCSVTCALLELLSEVIFSPIGYIMIKNWQAKKIGYEYIQKYCPNGVLES